MPEAAASAPAAASQDPWLAILDLGKLAPTPHNTQWYFVHPLNDQSAQIGIDSSISLPYTDPDDQFRFTGLGVFVRHLELAAAAAGYTLKAEADFADPEFPVTVTITGRQPAHTQLAALLQKRQTNRTAYEPVPISDQAVQAITGLNTPANRISLSSDRAIVKAVLDLNNKVLLNDLSNKGIGDELDHWIRYTKSSRAKQPTGFTPATLAVRSWKAWLVFHARPLMRVGLAKRWLTRQYFKQNMTGTVGWIYGPLSSRDDQYQAGRFMMDMWIKATELGYYLQPYGSIITNHETRREFLQDVGFTEQDGNMVWLAFRIGRSAKPARSPRKLTGDFIR